MTRSEIEARERAANLADEVALGIREGRALEWIEQILGTALIDAVRQERERCATVAERRVKLWESSGRRMSSPGWPSNALAESAARRNEAQVIADEIRAAAEQ